MGGWISSIGDINDFENRFAKFIKIFSVPAVPNLRAEKYTDCAGINAIAWAWTEHGIPDVYIKKDGITLLIMAGAITELGRFDPLLQTQDQAAEIVIELWRKQGEKIIPQINGSFSCLFYNQVSRETVLFCDRFASKSVWFGQENGIWIVGNFPSAIIAAMSQTPKLNPAGLWSLFHAGRQLGSQSLYSNIQALMAGQKAVFAPKKQAVVTSWWQRKYQPEISLSPKKWGCRLGNAIRNSANRYKKVSKKPHLFLSGGLDSRIVAAALKKPLKILTLCTNPNAETRIASIVARSLGLEYQIIIRSPYWYLSTTAASALISSGIYLNQHTHFIVPIRSVSSDNLEAAFLLGDLLENFNKHYFRIPAEKKIIFTPDTIEDALYAYVPYTIGDVSRIGRHFRKEIKKQIEAKYLNSLREYANSLMEISEDPADRFDTFLRWANVGVTPTYNMITCMWPLAEERNIFFDNELNELSLRIPSNLRGSGILHRWILHHLCSKLTLIPDANTFLPPILPKNIGHLTKRIRPIIGRFQRGLIQKRSDTPVLRTAGSWLFLHEMYRKDRFYREQIENLIFDNRVFPPDLFDLEQIKKTWEAYLAGNLLFHFEIEVLRSFGSLQKMLPSLDLDL